jgi:hypothetical protein
MASSSNLPFHVKTLYLLVTVAYIGLAINFVLFHQQMKTCIDFLPQSIQSFDATSAYALKRVKRNSEILANSGTDDFSIENNFKHVDSILPVKHSSHHKHHRHHGSHRSSRHTPDSASPVVEFFPKPQPTEQSPGHVWLSSYSRIPLPALQDFCFSSSQFCPAAQSGIKGEKGTAVKDTTD